MAENGRGKASGSEDDMPKTTEREIDLVYTVRVKTYGRKDLKGQIGVKLAKLCRLAFNDVEVSSMSGGESVQYSWSEKDHGSGVDNANDKRVV